MKTFRINLATQPFRNYAPLYGGLGTLLVLALGLTAYNAWRFTTTGTEASRTTRRIAESEERIRETARRHAELADELRRTDLKSQNRRAETMNALLARRNLSWTRLFNEIEAVLPYGVRLAAIRPAISGNDIRVAITAEAKTIDDVYLLEGRLEESPAFVEAYPTGELKTERGYFTFGMSVRYAPPETEPRTPAAALPTALPPAPGASAAPDESEEGP